MNYYGRRYRYYRRYPYRSYRRAYTTSTRSKRRAIGNLRAANQQKDSTQVNLSIPSVIRCFQGETAYTDASGTAQTISNGVHAVNIYDILRKSTFYQSYASMYDQMKIDSIQVKLTPYSFPVINESDFGKMYRSYTVVTAWDRTGLSDVQLLLVNKQISGAQSSDKIGAVGDDNGLYVVIDGDELSTYSSAITKNVNPNSNTSIVRKLYPSSIQEKSQYINTADLKKVWYDAYDADKGRYYGIPNIEGAKGTTVVADGESVTKGPISLVTNPNIGKNPAFIEEYPAIPFKPTLLVGIKNEPITFGPDNAQQVLTPEMVFSAEFDIVCTFRGLRNIDVVV